MTEMENWFYSGDNDIFIKSAIESRSKPLNDLGGKVRSGVTVKFLD